MKRYLLLFCSVVLIGALIAVPAFASELLTYEAQIEDGVGDFGSRIAPGTYVVTLSINGEALPLEDDLLIVTGQEDEYFEFVFDVDGTSYFLRITLSGNDAWCEYLLDDTQVVGSVGLCRVAPPVPDNPIPDPGSGDPLSDVFGVFSPISVWIGSSFSPLIGIFWNGSSFTFLGVLAVAALALSVVLLIVFVIVRFLNFSG